MASVLGGIGGFFKGLFHVVARFFGGIFQEEVNALTAFNRLKAAFETGRTELDTGIQRVKRFKFNPKWKWRVINGPDAVQHLQDLYDSLFKDIRDRLAALSAPVNDFIQVFQPEDTSQTDPNAAGGGLAKVALKVEEIVKAVNDIAAAAEQFVKFEQAFNEIILNLEHLDAIFLQQGNARKREKKSANIRLGKLHSS